MAAKARLAQRPHQIAQSLIAQEVQTFVGDFKLGLLLRLAHLPARARLLRRIVRLVDTDVVLLLHALDQLLDQFIQRAVHLHLLQAFAHFFIQQIATAQRLFDGLPQIVESLLAVRNGGSYI